MRARDSNRVPANAASKCVTAVRPDLILKFLERRVTSALINVCCEK